MARRRFFVPGIHHQRAELTGEDAHHLTRVLRVELGQRYEISDGESICLAEIAEAHKNRVVFQVVERLEPTPLPVRLTVLFSLIKFDRIEWLLEKCTEIGVERFLPVVAERSEKGLDGAVEKRRERWERILLESSQQSRRDQLPRIGALQSFASALGQSAALRYFLDEDRTSAKPLLPSLPQARQATDEVLILAGPEGGWTDKEREQAASAGWQSVSLGPQILRSETAAIVAAGTIMNAWASSS